MHKSQLGGFIIDCRVDDLDEATAFWSAALGLRADTEEEAGESLYRVLQTRPEDPYLETQQVDHESRVHLDIETDDIEAEVKRLVALGAKRLGAIKKWVVMEAPTGHRFCVVQAERANFEDTATTWD